MRRSSAVALLTLFVLGPLVAQAEAAEALALSMAELVHRNVIEPTAPPAEGEDLPPASIQGRLHPAVEAPQVVPGPFCLLDSLPVASCRQDRRAARRPGEAAWLLFPRNARQAYLQVFQF
jgi:hypothetical protein